MGLALLLQNLKKPPSFAFFHHMVSQVWQVEVEERLGKTELIVLTSLKDTGGSSRVVRR